MGRKKESNINGAGYKASVRITPPSVSDLHSAEVNPPASPPVCAVIALPLLWLVHVFVCVCVTTFSSDIHLQSRKTERLAGAAKPNHNSTERNETSFCSFLPIPLTSSFGDSACKTFGRSYFFNNSFPEKHPLVSSCAFPPVLYPSIFLSLWRQNSKV